MGKTSRTHQRINLSELIYYLMKEKEKANATKRL